MWLKRNGREEYKGIFYKYSEVDTKARSRKALGTILVAIFLRSGKWQVSSVARSLF